MMVETQRAACDRRWKEVREREGGRRREREEGGVARAVRPVLMCIDADSWRVPT